MEPGDIQLECPACAGEVGYDEVVAVDGGEKAGCPLCGEVFDPDEWFEEE